MHLRHASEQIAMYRRIVLLLVSMYAVALVAEQRSTGARNGAEGLALPAPNSTTAYEPFFHEGRGYWERDYLVYVDPLTPRVDVYDKDKNVASVKVTIPGYSSFSLSDATVTTDGHLVISGCSFADEGGKIHCFIGLADRNGHVSPLVDTERFAPSRISTCDGTTVWAMGWLRAPPHFDREGGEPYDVLRLYRLSDGKIIESDLPRSSFPGRSRPSSPGGFESPELMMQCRGTILGIYEGASDEWIEYDSSNSKLTRWNLTRQTHHFMQYDRDGREVGFGLHPTFITGLAMLDSGDVYASFIHEARDGSAAATVGLFQLHKAGLEATWLQVGGTLGVYGEPGRFDELCGTDGNNLVYSRFGEHHWFFSAAPH
jgi:hypothetical protein